MPCVGRLVKKKSWCLLPNNLHWRGRALVLPVPSPAGLPRDARNTIMHVFHGVTFTV